MYIRCFEKSRHTDRCLLHTGICLVWIAGLTLGFAADRFYGDVYYGFLEGSALIQPDFSGLVAINFLPLLISALAAYINPNLLYLLCLLRGLILGLGLGSCVSVYGSAGAVMAGLLLFSLVLYSPVLLWYWSWGIGRDMTQFRRNTAVCLGAAAVVAMADYWIVVPFLGEVLII